jgi:hypothetical protein
MVVVKQLARVCRTYSTGLGAVIPASKARRLVGVQYEGCRARIVFLTGSGKFLDA